MLPNPEPKFAWLELQADLGQTPTPTPTHVTQFTGMCQDLDWTNETWNLKPGPEFQTRTGKISNPNRIGAGPIGGPRPERTGPGKNETRTRNRAGGGGEFVFHHIFFCRTGLKVYNKIKSLPVRAGGAAPTKTSMATPLIGM